MSGRHQGQGRTGPELCFDVPLDRSVCRPTILFRRVRRSGDYIHFCHPCDDVHEGQSWFTVLGQRFHIGLVTVTVLRSLRKRLRAYCLKELADPAAHGWELDALAKAAGMDAANVLTRLAEFEARR